MSMTRRGLLTGAVAAAGAISTADHVHAHESGQGHGGQECPSDPALRVKALESLLVAKGIVDPAALDALIDTYAHKVGPRNGARVARADGERGRLAADHRGWMHDGSLTVSYATGVRCIVLPRFFSSRSARSRAGEVTPRRRQPRRRPPRSSCRRCNPRTFPSTPNRWARSMG